MATKTVYIKKPDGRREHIVTFQNAKQIVQQMMRAELDSRATSKKLATIFKEPEQKTTAAKVWYFLKNEIQYEAEPSDDQTAKTIRRFLSDKKGDCKHYATFAVGVLNACGIKTWFTFVGQDPTKKKPNHTYATALIDGKRVIIDPCRSRFNSEPQYYYRWDFNRK